MSYDAYTENVYTSDVYTKVDEFESCEQNSLPL